MLIEEVILDWNVLKSIVRDERLLSLLGEEFPTTVSVYNVLITMWTL